MNCQKGKTCVKQPAGSYPDLKIPVCTGCNKPFKDKFFDQSRFKKMKVGDRVEILRMDIAGRPKHRKHWYGRITRISGGECLVLPMWKKWETSLYYPEEITSV